MKKVQLTSEREFKQLSQRMLTFSRADHTRIYLSDAYNMTTRFANNEIIQNVAIRRPRLLVEAAFGKQVGRSTTDKLDGGSLKDAVTKAEDIARLSPEDPEFVEPLGPQQYNRVDSYSRTTGSRQPRHLADHVGDVVKRCRKDHCQGAGIVTANKSNVGVASSNGLFGFEARTLAAFSLTATLPDSTGWTMNNHRRTYKLNIRDRTKSAIAKAKNSASPIEVPAGRYDVILEPAAVTGLVGPMIWTLSAKNYFMGNSPYSNKLDQQIFDQRLQIESDPDNGLLLGTRIDRQGLPYQPAAWVKNGVLKMLIYDRFTATEHNQAATPYPNAIRFGFKKPTARNLHELIRETKKGILVTNFWYIRFVNRTDLTLTGMTRDGTFLIENGEIVGGIKNFRFHESPLRVFRQISGVTKPHEAVSNERGKMLAPYVKLHDFNFSSVTRF